MAIIQISRIIQRSGNLVDLPQLAEAELGWANDARRLFVGRGGSYDAENVEVLTSYSSISFGQLEGSYGNLDFSAPKTGQIITYDSLSNAWVNTGGNADQPANTSQYVNYPIHLGNVDNVKVGGGSLGYVLETDGQGNLSWSPKGSLYTVIYNLVNGVGNVITMTVPNTTPYTNSQQITITGGNISNSTASNNINGTSFYVKLEDDFSISGNVTLYTDAGLVTTANGAGLLTYQANSGIATAVLSSSSGGSGLANGITGAIQYKSTSGFFEGSAQLVWNTGNSLLNVSGNATLSGSITSSSLSATGVVRGSQIVSTATSPTAPIVVSSSVRIANANVQTAGNLINGTSNVIVNTSGNIALSVAGTANVLVATTSGVTVSGNANVGNLGTAGLITATGNIIAGNFFIGTPISPSSSRIQVVGEISMFQGGSQALGFNTAWNTGVSNWQYGSNGYAAAARFDSGVGKLQFWTSTNFGAPTANVDLAARVTIDNNGNVGIANTSPTHTLSVTGTMSVSGNANVGNIGATNGVIGTMTPFTVIRADTGSEGGQISFNRSVDNAESWAIDVYGNTTNTNLRIINSAGANVPFTVSQGGVSVVGTLSATGNANIGNIGATNGVFSNLSISGNADIGNTITRVITTGANTTTGTITGNWSLTSGSRLQATYADLAEYYAADFQYEPGTVLEFGGISEVTLATDNTTRVAGVVSTNPSYIMNSNCPGEIIVALALQGRVPVKVVGQVRKGDMMVSAGNGYATSSNNPVLGSIIGKSLENFEGDSGIIEIAIGRL